MLIPFLLQCKNTGLFFSWCCKIAKLQITLNYLNLTGDRGTVYSFHSDNRRCGPPVMCGNGWIRGFSSWSKKESLADQCYVTALTFGNERLPQLCPFRCTVVFPVMYHVFNSTQGSLDEFSHNAKLENKLSRLPQGSKVRYVIHLAPSLEHKKGSITWHDCPHVVKNVQWRAWASFICRMYWVNY